MPRATPKACYSGGMSKELSPRWRGTSQKARTAHMRALATLRMSRLSKTARRAIGNALVAARTNKHGHKENHA